YPGRGRGPAWGASQADPAAFARPRAGRGAGRRWCDPGPGGLPGGRRRRSHRDRQGPVRRADPARRRRLCRRRVGELAVPAGRLAARHTTGLDARWSRHRGQAARPGARFLTATAGCDAARDPGSAAGPPAGNVAGVVTVRAQIAMSAAETSAYLAAGRTVVLV